MISRNSHRGNDVSLRDEIVEIVHEIINKQRYVLIENLLVIAKKQTGAERVAVENVIDQLIRDKVIVPGSRLVKQLLLRNTTRKSIYDLVKKFVGININSIKKTLGLGSNAVMWHLSVLLKFGCIQEILYKTTSLFALPGLTTKEVILCSLLRRGLIRVILRQLESGRKSLADLEEGLGESRSTLFFNLRNLEEFEIISKSMEDANVIYYIFNQNSRIIYEKIKNI